MQEDWSDHTLVNEFAERYYERVLCFARQLTDPHTAEDVTQEVFLKLSRLEDLGDRVLTVSYLLKIAHNLIRGKFRREKRFRAIASELVSGGQEWAGTDAFTRSSALGKPMSMIEETPMRGLECLTTNEQHAITLTVGRGLSLREASEALGVKVSTVTNWKYRGLRKLAESGQESTVAA